jgi:hypothetical protein
LRSAAAFAHQEARRPPTTRRPLRTSSGRVGLALAARLLLSEQSRRRRARPRLDRPHSSRGVARDGRVEVLLHARPTVRRVPPSGRAMGKKEPRILERRQAGAPTICRRSRPCVDSVLPSRPSGVLAVRPFIGRVRDHHQPAPAASGCSARSPRQATSRSRLHSGHHSVPPEATPLLRGRSSRAGESAGFMGMRNSAPAGRGLPVSSNSIAISPPAETPPCRAQAGGSRRRDQGEALGRVGVARAPGLSNPRHRRPLVPAGPHDEHEQMLAGHDRPRFVAHHCVGYAIAASLGLRQA